MTAIADFDEVELGLVGRGAVLLRVCVPVLSAVCVGVCKLCGREH